MGRASRKNSPDCCAAGGPQSEVQSLHGAPNCWPSTAGPAGAEQPLRCRLQLAVLTGVDDHATVLPTARSHSRRQPLPTVGRATGRATASRVESVAPLSAFLLLCRPSLLLPRVTLPRAQYGIGKLPMAMHLRTYQLGEQLKLCVHNSGLSEVDGCAKPERTSSRANHAR